MPAPDEPLTEADYFRLCRALRGQAVPRLPARKLTPAEWAEVVERLSHFAHYDGHRAPDLPTGALPGSPAKQRVMKERRRRRMRLHHPADPGVSELRRVVRRAVREQERAYEEQLARKRERLLELSEEKRRRA
jgi:hypothetical protein